ncbi:MAG: peptidoglycan D,D-transpeptidase FtsI family protein [Candidatus Omnitrophota bacterium]
MKINNSERNRVFLLFIIFCLWVLFIGASLVKIQVVDYQKNVGKVEAQSNRTEILLPKRGTIFDCNGEVLAISVKAQSLYFNNKNNGETQKLFTEISSANMLTFTPEEKKSIERRIRRGEKFIWIKRKLSDAEYENLKQIRKNPTAPAIMGFVEEYKRIYPQQTLASHILGGVGIDEQGLYGIEYSVNDIVRGKGCKVKVVQDARQKAFDIQYLDEPAEGKDVYLTIDASIQFFVEKELKATIEKHSATCGMVIVMDSRKGALLAMASYPDFNPNDIHSASPKDIRNRAVSFVYHPGSTFKIITACTALESNICSMTQTFDCCNGRYQLTRDLRISDDHPHDQLSFEDVIVYSSNVGAAKIGEKLGRDRLYAGVTAFGFGQKPNLGLPDEESGLLRRKEKWNGISVDYVAHGYEIGVTPLQMIRAYNAIASGGYLLKPYIIKEIQGVSQTPGPTTRKHILSSKTIQQMAAIMRQVVERGTGKNSKIDGLPISAKTGTSKKIQRNKDGIRYYDSSFGGFFPSDDPRITMFVVIDEPKGQFYGGDVAAPLFKSVAEKVIAYLGIFPKPENPENPNSDTNDHKDNNETNKINKTNNNNKAVTND